MNQVTISAESILIKGISHDIRREIIRLVDEYPRSFTDLLNFFDISTGKLNYHLSQIKGFVDKNDEMRSNTDQKLVKNAFVAQKNAGTPLIVKGVSIMIVLLSFFILLHTSMFIGMILIFNELQGAVIIFPILIIIIAIELAGLYWLLQVRKSSPLFLEKLNRHLQEES